MDLKPASGLVSWAFAIRASHFIWFLCVLRLGHSSRTNPACAILRLSEEAMFSQEAIVGLVVPSHDLQETCLFELSTKFALGRRSFRSVTQSFIMKLAVERLLLRQCLTRRFFPAAGIAGNVPILQGTLH